MDARDVIAGKLPTKLNEAWANEIIAALTAAGYQIIHRDENHGPTLDDDDIAAALWREEAVDSGTHLAWDWTLDRNHPRTVATLRALQAKGGE